MKIAVLADIHGNMAYLARAKKIIDEEKLGAVIVCGDVQDEEAFLELDTWKLPVYLSFGNADYAIRERIELGLLPVSHLLTFPNTGTATLDCKKIAFTHYPISARELAESGGYDAVFYGHNHRPWEERIGRTVLMNPGEIQARDGKPSFAVFDLQKMSARLVVLV